MLEQEAWGQLTKEQFEQFLKLFEKKFGKPSRHKRLSFSFWNKYLNKIDTRIRITDGVPEVVQKVGTWEGATQWNRKEIYLKLDADPQQILNAYLICRNLLPPPNACNIMQYDNYVFNQPNFEIKLSRQTGKSDKYNFEVETLTNESSLEKILKDLGLASLVTITDVAFWDKWNQELNLSDTNTDGEQVLGLIKHYL